MNVNVSDQLSQPPAPICVLCGIGILGLCRESHYRKPRLVG